jgi:thiol-disulfide isomerase/thioredoxin
LKKISWQGNARRGRVWLGLAGQGRVNIVTVFEWALYCYACQRMLPHEKAVAQTLAERADRGDERARAEFRNLALKVISRSESKT